MKKTLVAILALSGMAMAATETPITLDNAFVKNGQIGMYSAVEDMLGAAMSDNGNTDNLKFDRLAHGNTGSNKGTAALNQTLTLAEMLSTGGDIYTTSKDTLLLTSIQIVSRNDTTCHPADATLRLSTGETATAVYPSTLGTERGLITFTFAEGVDITGLTTLTFGITAADTSTGNGFGYTCYQAKSGVTTLSGDSATFGDWHMATRLNVTKITTPEPATATLSLLALAGLAARRKRH